MEFIKSPGPERPLNRMLSDPDLPERIKSLEPRTLTNLVNQIGLEDCGEIIAFASAQQIERVFDEDLWRSTTAGGDESFDAERLGLWLEILLELGPDSATEKLVNMDPDFLTMALSQLIWVCDFDSLHAQSASDVILDKIMDSTNAYEREKRRKAQGFVPPADARVFLKLAEGSLETEDHISPAHLKRKDLSRESRTQNSYMGQSSREVLKLPNHRFTRVQEMLARDSTVSSIRMEELNYLAN